MKINLKLKDDQYEYTYIDHTRHIARAVLINDKNEVCLLKLLGDDDFGHRDYVETPGGGININEHVLDAVIREVKEETGCDCKLIDNIGIVDDYYNLIHRHNINYYFLLKVTGYGKTSLEEKEKEIIKEVIWVDFKTAINLYENMNKEKLEILVSRRELPIIKKAYDMLLDGEYYGKSTR